MDITKTKVPTDKSIKPELKVGTRTCFCQMCGEYYASPRVFDYHLLGVEETRCKTPKERRRVGLYQNEWGVWLSGGPKVK